MVDGTGDAAWLNALEERMAGLGVATLLFAQSSDESAVATIRGSSVLLEEIEVLEQAPAPVEIEARSADLTDSIPDALPPAVPPAVGVLLGRAPFEADEQAEAPFDPVLDLALVLTKFRRGSEASIAAEPPSERHDTQIQVMSRF